MGAGPYRFVEDQLRERGLTRFNIFGAENSNPTWDVLGAKMRMHRGPVPQRTARISNNPQAHIKFLVELQAWVGHQPVAAGDIVFIDAREIDGKSIAGAPGLAVGVVRVDAADAGLGVKTGDPKSVFTCDLPGEGGAGYDKPGTSDREDAINTETEMSTFGLVVNLFGKRRDLGR